MPTVDGSPQKWEWMLDYSKLDKLYTYSWFGKKVLETLSRTIVAKQLHINPLTINNVMQPGVDLNIFRPLPKNEVKKRFGVKPEIKFCGTVMRNQPRKLIPRIIRSFRIFKEKYPAESENVYLLLHTSIPDVGWDIPEAIRRNGVGEWVRLSYLCHQCKGIGLFPFMGSPTNCPMCGGQNCCQTPNTQIGFDDERFAWVFNLMDVYIQGSIAEGDGMPVNEAKACGVPCLVSDFSALYEKARNGGALPIDNLSEDGLMPTRIEHETMQDRSLFNRIDLADKLALLFGDEEKRQRLSKEALECAQKYYGWELCTTKWEWELDSIEIKNRKETWEKPIEIKEPVKEPIPDNLNNKEWLDWCYKNILMRPKGIDESGLQYWSKAIESSQDQKKARNDLEKFFRKMTEDENKSKKILENPRLALTDPIQIVRDIVEEAEKNE
jgi:glycosyltransferase involved in cell wall biosynthesis